MFRSLFVIVVTILVPIPAVAQTSYTLDNTGNLQLPGLGQGTSLAVGNADAVVFTPNVAVNLTDVKFGLLSTVPGAFNLQVIGTANYNLRLTLYDTASNLPTTALATYTTGSMSIAGATLSAYYTFDVRSTSLGALTLQPNHTYALALGVESTGTQGAELFLANRLVAPTDSSSHIGYVQNAVFNGSSWTSANAAYEALSFSPVPEPATVGLTATAGLVVTRWWRRRPRRSAMA